MPLLDYNYVTNKGLGFAIYTGCCKAPASEELDRIWKSHKKAMMKFIRWVSYFCFFSVLLIDESMYTVRNG